MVPYLRKNFGLIFCLLVIFVLLLIRVSSYKYSRDTAYLIDLFRSILFDQSFYSNIGRVNNLGLHFSPVLIFFSPLYFLGPTGIIFFWKMFCFGSFLIIIWSLIKNLVGVSEKQKNYLLFLITLHPTFITNLTNPTIWDIDISLPLLALSIYFFTDKKYLISTIIFCLTFFVKENMPLVGIFFGIFIILKGKKIIGLSLSIFSILAFFLITVIIMPKFSTSGDDLYLLNLNFGYLGNSMGEALINILKDPSVILKSGNWLRKIFSIVIMFSCFGFLPFMNRSSLIYLIPGLITLMYALIAQKPFLDYSKHYMLVFFVFLVWSSIHSFYRVNTRTKNKVILFSLISSLTVTLVLQIYFRTWSYYFFPIPNVESLKSAAKLIPPKAQLITHGVGSPWVGYNKKAYILERFQPEKIKNVNPEYILINLKTVFWEEQSEVEIEILGTNLRKLNSNIKYNVLFYENDIVVLKRKKSLTLESNQVRWSKDLAAFDKMNQIRMKPQFIRTLRSW
jgi:uncharacterized membrane protein